MHTIGIIGAMEEETAFLQEKMMIVQTQKAVGLDFFVGRYSGKNVILVKSGIGKVNAAICAQVLIDRFGVDCIINIGVAGAIYDQLKVGDIVISTDAVQHDMDTSVLGDPVGIIPRMEESYFPADPASRALAADCIKELAFECQVYEGRIASGDQFIAGKEAKEKIWKTVKGYCAEMEGAAIAQSCYLNDVPFLVIRAISDSAAEGAEMTYEQFSKLAAQRGSALVEKMIEKM